MINMMIINKNFMPTLLYALYVIFMDQKTDILN